MRLKLSEQLSLPDDVAPQTLAFLGRTLDKLELGHRTRYAPDGGGFNNAISRLRTLELVEGRGDLRASSELFRER